MNRLLLSRLSAAAARTLRHQSPHQRFPNATALNNHCYPHPYSAASVVRTVTTTPTTSSSSSSSPSSSSSSSPPPSPAPHTHTPIPTDTDTTQSEPSASDALPSSPPPSPSPDAVSDTMADHIVTNADTISTAADVAASGASAGVKSTAFSDMLLTPAMTMINGMHDVTGLPWWLSIALATVTIRTALLPFTLMTMKNSATMQALKDEIAFRRESVMEAARSGDRKLSALRQKEMQVFMRDAGVAPARVLIGPLVQFPVFISFFISIRRLAVSDPTFADGGVLWFTDLSAMDPLYILPVICGGSLMAMTELGGDTGSASTTPQMRIFMRVVSVLSVPMTYWFPAAVFCYWIPNNFLSMALGIAMRKKTTRKLLGMNVDPAKIPGTRAHKIVSMKLNLQDTVAARAGMDPAQAMASYAVAGKKSVKASDVVKPVLLKSKPKKKKKTATTVQNQ